MNSRTVLVSLQFFSAMLLLLFLDSSLAQVVSKGSPQTVEYYRTLSDTEEVLVEGTKQENLTVPTVLTQKLLDVPGTFGDPLRAVFSLPGVVEAEEGEGAPAVRGSGPEDNEFLIDFLPTSYVFHDFGNSVFNEHLIREFGLKAAGFGARYGEATGAIFDVRLREPRQEPITTTLDASFLRAGLLVEGRVTDSQAFYISMRESLVHIILQALEDDIKEEDDIAINDFPRSSDYQAKYSWVPNQNNRISILATGASDNAALTFGDNSEEVLLDPGSAGRISLDTDFNSVGLRWDYSNGRNVLKTGIGILNESRRDRIGNGQEFQDIDTKSLTAKSHYTRHIGSTHSVTAGIEYSEEDVDYSVKVRFQSCSDFDPACETDPGTLVEVNDQQKIVTTSALVEDKWQITPSFSLTTGVRFEQNDYLDEQFIEPRVASEWALNDQWSLSASAGKYHQLPFVDEIVPVFGNPQIDSPTATHYVLGTSGLLADGWSLSADLYYKELENLVVNVDDERNYVNAATGRAYGAELMLEREKSDNWYGWLSLSYAKTERTNLLVNETIDAQHDTPLVVNLVLNYQWNDWNLGARWNYRSGMPYTPINGNFENPDFPGFYLPVYGALNSERADAYHRLDLRAEKPFQLWGLDGSYYIDIINAYGNKNSGRVEYEAIADSAEFRLVEAEGLPLIPSIGFSLKF